jgi:hypothetical protein
LGAFVILAAICALRFDLASLLLPDVPASAEVQRAAAMKRVSAGGAAALDLRPVEDGTGKSASSTFDVVRIDPDGASVFAGVRRQMRA